MSNEQIAESKVRQIFSLFLAHCSLLFVFGFPRAPFPGWGGEGMK
jgi:hypothetical protein